MLLSDSFNATPWVRSNVSMFNPSKPKAMMTFVEITRHSRVECAMNAVWRWQYRNRRAIARMMNRVLYRLTAPSHEI